MVQFLTAVYLFYIFASLYLLFLYILIYLPHRKEFFSYPKPLKEYTIDIVVPCYNEEKTIEKSVNALLESDYPGLKKIIVVDDCSTDSSFEIIKNLAKKNPKILAVRTPKNTGKASGSKNYGSKFATSELIGFIDSDSFPEKTAISKMVGFFNEEKIGAVTSLVLVSNSNNPIEKFQMIEYRIIAFTRKLLGFVDGIYVTPGALAIYSRKVFEEIGKFDEKNMTEDIEITWNMVSRGYNIRMSSPAVVHTEVPDNLKAWFKQRVRWNVGGLQTINKYRSAFVKKGMLGSFILPFFVISWLIGLSGLAVLIYQMTKLILVKVLSLTYSIQAQSSVLRLNNLNLFPNILVFFGIVLFILGLAFTLVALKYTRETGSNFKRIGLLSLLGYLFLYLLAYPIILIISVYKKITKKYSW
jgi:cellulose synthase/poly-beta-1,6-N-acetylglucosamine synthase-like glycosyltransferase